MHVDDSGRAYEAVVVSVNVRADARNSKRMIVSPSCKTLGKKLRVAPKEFFIVRWEYYPGGEIIPGGWRLVTTTYGNRLPALPGFKLERVRKGEELK